MNSLELLKGPRFEASKDKQEGSDVATGEMSKSLEKMNEERSCTRMTTKEKSCKQMVKPSRRS